MTVGLIGYDNARNATGRPSPAVWRGCPHTILNDLGEGIYSFNDFLAIEPTATAVVTTHIDNGLSFVGDTATVLLQLAGEVGGYIDLETDGDDNDGGALISEPFGRIIRDSDKKLWFETVIQIGDITGDQGAFFGLVEEAGTTHDVVADAGLVLVGESLIGFQIKSGNPDAIDIVYKKDAGTVVEVLADATKALALDSGDRSALVNDTDVHLGIRFNGHRTLEFFIDGVKVAEQEVDSTVDQAKNYCAILALKTGAAAAESFASGYCKYAAQLV